MRTIMFFLLFFTELLTGCVGIRYFDKITKDSPKGYIDFYCVNAGDVTKEKWISHHTPLVYGTVNKEKVFYGKIPHRKNIKSTKTLRITKSPGVYYIAVYIFDVKYVHKIEVKENMVTPVEIVFTCFNKSIPLGENNAIEKTVVYTKTYLKAPVSIFQHCRK